MSLSCHFHRLQLEQSQERGFEPSGKTLAHVKSCNSCQRWYQNQRQMISSLRRQARTPQPRQAPQLLPGVMAAIRHLPDNEVPLDRPAPSMSWNKWLAPAATVCLTIVIATQWNKAPSRDTTLIDGAKWLALSPEALVHQTTGQSINEWGKKLDEPLEQEWMLIKEDAKAAIGGMAGTFLPSKFSTLYTPTASQQP